MFELPEYITIARQMADELTGKRVSEGRLGNSLHKFVWYNRTPNEFSTLIKGKVIGKAYCKGRWLFVPMELGYVLVFGECGGKILFHVSETLLPKKFHLVLAFEDGSALSAMTQMWGAMELYQQGEELKRQYIVNMRKTPIDPGFNKEYFFALIDECIQGEKRSVKSLLTQDQIIPGLGNSIAQDILFKAKLHPKHSLDALSIEQKQALYQAVTETVLNVIEKGGRYDEFDLYGHPGGYIRLMDKNAAGKPCSVCGTKIEKMSYLGGACYFCPSCQV